MSSTRDRVRRHRERLRSQGLRPVQIWVPDVRAPEFIAEAHRQSVAMATSEGATDDQAFIDAVSRDGDSDDEPPLRRGDLYTAAVRGPSTGKPRPVVVVQDDRFGATASVTVCPLTTGAVEAPLARIDLEPSDLNGLDRPSRMMVDKVTTVPRASLGARIGRLGDEQLLQLNRSLTVFLGLASPDA